MPKPTFLALSKKLNGSPTNSGLPNCANSGLYVSATCIPLKVSAAPGAVSAPCNPASPKDNAEKSPSSFPSCANCDVRLRPPVRKALPFIVPKRPAPAVPAGNKYGATAAA